MGKPTRYNNVHQTLTVTPPPAKTWKTPSYKLERYTLRRHVHVVSVQLYGIRGNERRTESISFPLLPGVPDIDFVRAAVWFSPNKWTVAFGMNVSQFQGKFSSAVDGQLIASLMGSSQQHSPHLSSQQQMPPMQQTPLPPPLPSPYPQPGQFQPFASTSNQPPSPRGATWGMWGWYQTKSRKAKVGIGCGTLLALLVFFSIIGTALGNANPTPTLTPTPTHQVAQAVIVSPTAVTHSAPSPTMIVTVTVKPQPTRTVTPKPTQAVAQPTPTPPPVKPTPTAAPRCYPLTNSGNCYEPGEYCRNADHGASGIAGDGEAIRCTNNNGWRWEPSH